MTIRPRKSSTFRSRALEQLETRDMLAGHGFGDFHHFSESVAASVTAQIGSFAATQANVQALAHSAVFAGQTSSTETELTAQLTDPNNSSALGSIKYEVETHNGTSETELKVAIRGATASSTLDVTIGGVVVGQLTTDANGAGKLVLSSDPTGTEQALPANFPTSIAAGTAVSVGTLAGTLATPEEVGCHAANGTNLSAALTDANGTDTGTIIYHTSTKNGVTTTTLAASVTGATASSTLDVTIGGTIVGQITTDANGAGTLVLSSNPTGTQQPLPANFPTSIVSGMAVSIGTASGTLAASGATSDDSGNCHASQHTNLSAALTDTSSSATGTVAYRTGTSAGVTTTTLTASVTGAAASSTLDVTIGGTIVGQVTTDANGAGTLVLSSNPTGTQQPLPANFPTSITAGTTVTIGTLSGTFAHGESSVSHSFRRLGRHG